MVIDWTFEVPGVVGGDGRVRRFAVSMGGTYDGVSEEEARGNSTAVEGREKEGPRTLWEGIAFCKADKYKKPDMYRSCIRIHVWRTKRDHKMLKILTKSSYHSAGTLSRGKSLKPVKSDSEGMVIRSRGGVSLDREIQGV